MVRALPALEPLVSLSGYGDGLADISNLCVYIYCFFLRLISTVAQILSKTFRLDMTERYNR
jgi:hypothetical protein